MNLQHVTDGILSEISATLRQVDEAEVRRLIAAILEARHIVVFGVGRMGLVSRAFAMRLCHLGLRAYALGESTTPGIGPPDLLLLNSGSGETQTVYDVALMGQKAGARLATITARPTSRIGRLADVVVRLPGPTKVDGDGPASIQPMTTLNDQSLLLLLDAVAILLMEATRQSSDDLWRRHSNLE
ncbi:MAG: SIS domain-containing protein [Chloroflexi bacterium]|nr:SIS domain-containing protein [Chloroflexota bacterium]